MHRLIGPGLRVPPRHRILQPVPIKTIWASEAVRGSQCSFTSSSPSCRPPSSAKAAITPKKHSKIRNTRNENQTFVPPAANRPGPGAYNPLVQQLASRDSPILIYQSESKAPYVTGCLLLGATCVGYALINGHTILFDPLVDPSTFVKVTFGLVCTAMLGFGWAAFYKTFRIVRSITVLPVLLSTGQRSLRLRLEYGNYRSRSVDVPYDAVITSKRIFVPPTTLSNTEKLQHIQQAKERREWERQRILTLPFRQSGNLFARGFRAFRRVLLDEGWVFLYVKGRRSRWKLHEKPAWALRNGKHLDDLVKRTYM